MDTEKFFFKDKPGQKFNELKIAITKLKNNLHNYLNFVEQVKQQRYITRQKNFLHKLFLSQDPKKITNQQCAKKLHELLIFYLQEENLMFSDLTEVSNINKILSAINNFILKFSNVLSEFYGIGDEYNFLAKPVANDELNYNIRSCLLDIHNYLIKHFSYDSNNAVDNAKKLNLKIKNKIDNFIIKNKNPSTRDLLLLTNCLRENLNFIYCY